jgi:hypothetical protein
MVWLKEKQWQPGQAGNPQGINRGVKPGTVRNKYRRRQMTAAEIDRVMNDPELRARIEKLLNREVEYRPMPEHDPSPVRSDPSPVRHTPWTPRVVEEGEQAHIDPLDYLQRTIDNPQMSHRDKVFAASNLAPYVHPKRTGQFISNVISLPPPTNAADATLQIGIIMQYVRAGYATVEEGDKLIAHLRAFVDAGSIADLVPRVTALEQAQAARGDQPAAQIGLIVEGGLPVMPGAECVVMPSDIQMIEGYGR